MSHYYYQYYHYKNVFAQDNWSHNDCFTRGSTVYSNSIYIYNHWITTLLSVITLLMSCFRERDQNARIILDAHGENISVYNIKVGRHLQLWHMNIIVPQITCNLAVYSTVCTDKQQTKHRSITLLVLCEGNPLVTDVWIPLTKGQ